MDGPDFVDDYEILEISRNANAGTVDRIFRHLAQLYHPDNPKTGDRQRFDTVLEAYNTLKDPVQRAEYDIRHQQHSIEHLRFHLWYLKEKGWTERTDTGKLAISAEGVDRANSERHREPPNKLLTDRR